MVTTTSSIDHHIQEARAMLRPYQVGVVNRMVSEKRHLNYMEMGMGKSLCTLLSVNELKAYPCMIVCPKSAMTVLQVELQKWFEMDSTVYVGTPKKREKLFREFVQKGHKFIITNYALSEELGKRFGIIPDTDADIAKGKSFNPPPGTKWKLGALMADEIQLGGLFNHKSKTYKAFAKLAKDTPVVYLMTGTPFRKGCVDFFGPLSLVDPKHFDSYWKYVNKYCMTINTGFGKSIERNPRDVVAFRNMLRRYASILKVKDHLKDMPEKNRQAIPIEMDKLQAKTYEELETNLFAEINEGEDVLITPSQLSLRIRLRQLLACPKMIGIDSYGSAIETMVEMTEDIVENRQAFVVFTPFRQAVQFIRERLLQEYPNLAVHMITGGLTTEEFGKQWQAFQNGRGARVLICVIKSGASFHATCAQTAFFIGCEYDFNQNAQAEARLHRIGQQSNVNIYYMLHKHTVEDEVIDILNDKQYSADLILSSEELFKRMIAKRRG
jgi:SWI/SNF-related matrix-associated actin-dependent regulator 1 of chromatin subfamily A